MSLFPAFADAVLPADVSQESWLANSSFQVELSKKTDTLTSYDSSRSNKKHKKKKSSKIEKKADQKPQKCGSTSSANDVFFIDKKSTKEFLTVKTISKPSVAHYKIHYYMFNKTRQKYASFRRYFKEEILKHSSFKTKNYGSRSFNESTDSLLVSSDLDSCKAQEELLQTTAFYNKSLTDNPTNVEMWLRFIDFQDTIFKAEKSCKKGSFAKAIRTNAERKLNILEKALFHNLHSENLHRRRLHIMVSVYPADELQKQLKQLLDKDNANIILWQGYIEATQCSMSHCNTLSVLNLYITCLSTLHKLKRNTNFDIGILEESILRMLHQCGLFLKQSGHFERLWTLLKMYLEINLGQLIQNSFNIPTNSNEKQVLEQEDIVFKSQLPRHELWLRIEKLRELCHWLPVTEECPDPQRIIFTNDVFELIQPITMPENTFRLIVTILTLLKIPLLPCRHNTMQELGLDHVPWALDSIETLLPMFYEIYPVNLYLQNFFIDFQLVIGPQYLKVLPGQEEYLNFILTVMQKCIDSSQGENKSSLIVWWLRFQRLLIILNKTGRFRMPANIMKNIKSNVKSLLKKAENRNNAILYIEYALLEKEMSSDENCVKILQTALSFTKHQNSEPIQFKEQRAKCYLIRTLVETMIRVGKIDRALKYLVNFVLDNSFDSECELDEATLEQASIKFESLTSELLQMELQKLPPVEHFLPIFFCDWIICNGWFIYFRKSPLECGQFLERVLENLNNKMTEEQLHKEIIYEFNIVIMLKLSMNDSGFRHSKVMENVMYRALQYFPNNLFLLSSVANRQYMLKSLGPKWWGTKKLLLNNGHALPVVVLISTTYQIMTNYEQDFVDLLTGIQIVTDRNSFKFKMLSLFKEATKADMCTRRCGLVWRLYLQFVHKYFDTKLCRQIYYSAVEECPWLKALYIDAAIYIPTELGQVQDLLVEKQLRIHITPEELDILCD